MSTLHQSPATICVTLNGEPASLPLNSTVQHLLTVRNLQNQPCAVEVNKTVIPKAHHASHLLVAGDIIEIVTLVGGG
jgi:thiamine biosynthesis protein ThiS